MGRKAYPSDHRRWFRVTEDILDNAGLRSLGLTDQAVWFRILASFNRMRADQTGDHIVLNWTDAMAMLCSRTRHDALKRAARLARGLSVGFACVPEGLLIHIPKWSETQRITPTHLKSLSVAVPSTTTTTTTTTRDVLSHPDVTDSPPTPQVAESQRARAPAAAPTGSVRQSPQAAIRERVLALWPRLVEAAGSHNAHWISKPGSRQIDALAKRIRAGASDDDLVNAIHGYASRTEFMEPQDRLRHFTVASLYRPSNFDANVESGAVQAAQGQTSEADEAANDEVRRAIRANNEKVDQNGGF